MTTRVAVVVPGIMGSVLYRGPSGHRSEIWGENFWNNYRRLAHNSSLLSWDERPAEALLLKNVYVTNIPLFNRFPKERLWRKLLQHLERHEEFRNDQQRLEYGYDWRQSLLETAQDLGAKLDKKAQDLADSRGLLREDLRYVFLTHSMGGLVVRIALALKVLYQVRVYNHPLCRRR